MEPKKFSIHHLIIKLTSRKFWVWIATTALVWSILNKPDISLPIGLAVVVVWGIVATCYFAPSFKEAFAKAISEVDISLGGKGR